MSSRHDGDRLGDILDAIVAIKSNLMRGDLSDGLVFDAVGVRLIEIGEAVKALDPAMLADAAAHGVVVTAEDGIAEGGAGTSIASALRPNGMRSITCGMIPQLANSWSIGVSMMPGWIELTRTPDPASSIAADRVMPRTAHLLAA